jgi:hypothetical protein
MKASTSSKQVIEIHRIDPIKDVSKCHSFMYKNYCSSYFDDLRTKEATTIAPTAAMLPTIASPITPSDI